MRHGPLGIAGSVSRPAVQSRVLPMFPAALTTAAILWFATLIAAPYALTSDNPHVVSAAAFVYRGAGFICHQRASRSFHLAGVQLPVCARCAGLYVSGAVAAMAAWMFSRRPGVPANTRRVVVLAAIPTALSVILEWTGILDPTNLGRFLCALPLGAGAAWIFVQALRAEARLPPSPQREARSPASP
jgi:uncharacterized membrane protein